MCCRENLEAHEIDAAHTKPASLLIFKADGTYSYRSALKV
jgi:hypothetical protein